jgi:enoyl-CoA hydratase
MELATRVASDPELARVTVGNFRKEVVDGAVGWDVAMQFERPAQMWSMRRAAQ